MDRVAGGSDRDDNLVLMCAACNRWKPVHDTRAAYDAWLASGYWQREMDERRWNDALAAD